LQKNISIDAEPEEGHCKLELEDLHATPFDQTRLARNPDGRAERG